MKTCPACMAPVTAAEARFCASCGAQLLRGSGAPGERRQVTALFIDIAGFTALASTLDPEELEELVAAYHALVAEVVSEARGCVEEYLGDGTISVFGYPIAAEDAASRAIKAASTVIERVSAQGIAGHRIALRAGVATGEVAVKPGQGPGQRLTGLVLATAARLQGVARPDGIVASALTRQLAARNYIFTARPPMQLKGIGDEVTVYDVRDPGHAGTRTAPLLFGRDDALAQLAAARGPVVIWGEPGIGKSALAAVHAAGQGEVVTFQATSIASSTSHGPVIDWLRTLIGVPITGREIIAEAFPALPEVDIGFLGLILGAPESLKTYAELMPARISAGVETALLAVFRSLVETRPVLFLWEDLHWLDAASLALLEASLRIEGIRVLATARPDAALEARLEQAGLGAIRLSPLAEEEARKLADVAGGGAIAPQDVAEIARRAEGVPLYLEQLALAMRAGETFGGVPPTLKDLLTARLDRSGPAKPVAQIAAALGRRFDIGLLAALSEAGPEELSRRIADLRAAGIVQSLADGGVRFTHALLRDAAYDSMLLRERRALHGRIGDILVSGEAGSTAAPEAIADHYLRAGRLVDGATHLAVAARAAAARGAYTDAEAHLRRAVAELRPTREHPDVRPTYLAALIQLGATLMQTQGFTGPDVIRAYEEAEELSDLDGAGFGTDQTIWGSAVYHSMLGDLTAARRHADAMAAVARRSRNAARGAEIEMASHVLANCIDFYQGRFRDQFPHLAHIRENYDVTVHGPLIPQYGMDFFAAAQMFELHARAYMGETGRIDALVAEADAHQELLDIPLMRPYASIWGAVPYVFAGQLDRALERIEPGIELADRQGDVFWSITGRIWQAIAEARRNAAPQWQAQLATSLETCRIMGVGIGRAYFEAELAGIEARLGDCDGAGARMAGALADLEAGRDGWMAAEIRRLSGGLAEIAGDAETAGARYRAAAATAAGQGAALLELAALDALDALGRAGQDERARRTDLRASVQAQAETSGLALDG